MAWGTPVGASTLTKTCNKAVTTGELVIVFFACGDGTSTPTISDSSGHTWTALSASPKKDVSNGASASGWFTVATVTATITVTIADVSAGGFNGTSVTTVTGQAASSIENASNGGTIAGSSSSNGMTTGSVTTTADGCLIFSFIVDDGSTRTSNQYTAGTSPNAFTELSGASQDPGGASDATYAVEYFTQTSAGAINPTWTQGNTDTAVGLTAAFKVASGGETITMDKWNPMVREQCGPRYSVVSSGMTPPSKIN